MKIRTRLLLGFSSIAVITILGGIFTYYTYLDVIEISQYHTYIGLPSTNTISEIRSKLLESETFALEYILGEDSAKKEYLQTKSEIFLLITTYESIFDVKSQNKNIFLANAEIDEVRQNYIYDIKNTATEFYSLIDKIHTQHELGQASFETDEPFELLEEKERKFVDMVNLAYKMEFDDFLKKQNELYKINQNYMISYTTFTGFLIASIFGIGFFISNSISKPLLILENSIKKTVSEGLQDPLPLKGDEEIKRLTQSFNELEYSLKKLDI